MPALAEEPGILAALAPFDAEGGDPELPALEIVDDAGG